MSSDVLESYYREDFGSDRHRQGQIVNAKTNVWAVRRLLGDKMFKSFLDVGTGYGFLLKELENHMDVSATGVELSKQEATYGAKNLDVRIINHALRDSGLQLGSFDVVACFEVIEHIPEPIGFVGELLEYLKPDGRLLIMTDNFGSRVARELGPGFPKWIPHSHISHFDASTLQKLLYDSGLVADGFLSYTPWELWARNLYYKMRGIRKTPEQAFDLSTTLETEMQGGYRFFGIRRVVNAAWARLTARQNLDGALMYVVARRTGSE